jgi:Na+-transporting NADH:ubiquinone oxidoreductase subunit NqrD
MQPDFDFSAFLYGFACGVGCGAIVIVVGKIWEYIA